MTNHAEYCILVMHAKIGSEKSLYLMDGQDPPGFVCLEIEILKGGSYAYNQPVDS